MRRIDEDERDRPRAPRAKGPKAPGKHARIRQLACIEDVDRKLKENRAIPDVAEYIQEVAMEATDISRQSLITGLHRYKKDMTPVELTERVLPDLVQKAEERVAKGLNELEELERIFELQMGRVELGMQFEKSTRILNRFVNQEVALAAQILQKRHNMKMDLGFDGGRDLGTLSIRPELAESVRDRHGADVAEAMSDAEARGRALSIARSLALLDGEAAEEVLGEEDD